MMIEGKRMSDSDIFLEEKLRRLDLNLKYEQQLAVKELSSGNDVLAVLPTGFGKSRIYQAFARLKAAEKADGVTLLVISPLNSIIEDQLADLRSRGFVASALASLKPGELKNCDAEILLSSAEDALKSNFTAVLKNTASRLHQRLCCIVVDESHTVETWTGKR